MEPHARHEALDVVAANGGADDLERVRRDHERDEFALAKVELDDRRIRPERGPDRPEIGAPPGRRIRCVLVRTDLVEAGREPKRPAPERIVVLALDDAALRARAPGKTPRQTLDLADEAIGLGRAPGALALSRRSSRAKQVEEGPRLGRRGQPEREFGSTPPSEGQHEPDRVLEHLGTPPEERRHVLVGGREHAVPLDERDGAPRVSDRRTQQADRLEGAREPVRDLAPQPRRVDRPDARREPLETHDRVAGAAEFELDARDEHLGAARSLEHAEREEARRGVGRALGGDLAPPLRVVHLGETLEADRLPADRSEAVELLARAFERRPRLGEGRPATGRGRDEETRPGGLLRHAEFLEHHDRGPRRVRRSLGDVQAKLDLRRVEVAQRDMAPIAECFEPGAHVAKSRERLVEAAAQEVEIRVVVRDLERRRLLRALMVEAKRPPVEPVGELVATQIGEDVGAIEIDQRDEAGRLGTREMHPRAVERGERLLVPIEPL